MDTAELVVAVVAAIIGLFGIAGFLQLGDARRWRKQDDERRAGEEAARARDLARRKIGVRHERSLNKALDLMHEIKVIACAVVNRDELLTAGRIDELDLKEHLTALGVLSSTLPDTVKYSLCRCHRGGVSQLAEALMATPFPPDRPRAANSAPESWTKAEVGLAALHQHDAAEELVSAIDAAENLVRDHLPV
ncbi:hypothetical protein [Catellatospora citrea]|uniref:Uncharacterized protein n=1 Tax=Catellatospora citrea TaxID=53366 RepID=A0A8J3KUE7_9ACTN|nr:hypothetical protein [Catellatospora citrea]RKE07883.1 hypothetical protein C8E86_2722 [Catellatospora citrea]GIG02110.1 hypothetical protein Cci01nite_72030 [Catellatospora citrea]